MRVGLERRAGSGPGWLFVVLAVLATLTLPTSTAFASDFAPADDPYRGYHTGLEPGSALGGQALPVDWSLRESPCEPAEPRPYVDLRVGPRFAGALCPGDVGEAVRYLQLLLAEKKLYREPITGEYDTATQYAVATFHKLIGPAHPDPATARDDWIADPPPEDWTTDDWEMLRAFEPRAPKYRPGQPDRVEVDVGHQVLYLVEGGEVAAIIPVSTGRGTGVRGCSEFACGAFVTPRTDRMPAGSAFYTAHNFGGGWGGLYGIYKAVFYRGNHGEWYYGLHGYRHVPHHPQSKGCVRLTTWDMDFLRPTDHMDDPSTRLAIGMPIHVWDE